MGLNFDQISGQTDSHLVLLDNEQHRLQADVATAYQRMKNDAAEDGVSLAIASGFRSLERQLSIWNRKWQGQLTLRDHAGQAMDIARLTGEEKLWAILHWSALPGASRHHWGTDLDVYDPIPFTDSNRQLHLVPPEYTHADGPCYTVWRWLKRHAGRYGFFFPYARYQNGVAEEPWHLSYQPLSGPALEQLTVEKLAALIAQLDIEGQQTVLEHIKTIHQQYVLNICGESAV